MTTVSPSPRPDQDKASAPVSPAPLLQLAIGFMASKHLFVANELGLFARLASGPASLPDLAEALATPERTLRIVVDAMVALGLLERAGAEYRNSPVAGAYLAGATPADLRPFLRLLDQICYPRWQGLEAVVRGHESALLGETAFEHQLPPEKAQIFSAGVAALTAGSARALAEKYDFSGHQRVLDVGGGNGSFLATILQRHPALEGTLFEIPAVADVARATLATTSVHERIAIVAGNCFSDDLPANHDAMILANVVHVFSPQHNRELFRRMRSAALPGTRMLLVDFWTNPDHTEPAFAALMAGEFLQVTHEGDVYSVQEVGQWLEQTGWRLSSHVPLGGPTSLLVAEVVSQN
jgi:hypothetical protein